MYHYSSSKPMDTYEVTGCHDCPMAQNGYCRHPAFSTSPQIPKFYQHPDEPPPPECPIRHNLSVFVMK